MIKRIDLRTASAAPVARVHNAALTFTELAQAWLATGQHGNEALVLKKWLEVFGRRCAWEITRAEIEQHLDAMRGAGYKESSINRNLSSLGSVYAWVIKARRAPAGFVSPTRGIERRPEAIRVVEYTAEQLDKLRAMSLTWSDKRFALFVHLLLDSGARKSELLERVWADFDLDGGTVLLRTSKTGKPRLLHFTPDTAALIRRLAPHRPADALAFPGKLTGRAVDYKGSWNRLTASVGLSGMRQHDARHDRARRLLVAGVSLPVAASIMGHSAKVLESRYGHLAIAEQRAAVEAAWRQTA